MRKTRKKKNQRLMRSIRRTVASLFMVMAIIVAAIPVEQYGSLQAAEGTSTKVEELYQELTEDGSDSSTNSLESAYSGDTIRIQRVTGSGSGLLVTEVYEAVKHNDEAMITSYLGDDTGDLSIQAQETASYEIIDTAYIEAIKNLLAEESYSAEFSVSDEITYEKDELEKIALTKLSEDAVYQESNIQSKGTITTEDTASAANNFHILGKAVTAKDIYETAVPAVLEEQQKKIQEYNARSEERIVRLEELAEKDELTEEETAEWNAIAEAVKAESESENISLEYTFADLCSYDTNGNGIPEIVEYTIYQRLQDKTGSSLQDDYVLEGGQGLYVLRSRFDDSYLSGGTVKITGIQSRAFAGKNITGVTIPDSITFIGDAAFAECGRLSKVAFSDSEEAENTTLTIGRFAFYNCTALTDITFPDFMKYIMRTGAFSLSSDKGATGAMSTFTFPSNMSQIIEKKSDEEANDYILAGRQTLKTVTMPEVLGQNGNGTIPANTFLNCFQLADVIFPDGAYDATFDSEKLFSSVSNESFKVTGPATDDNGKESAVKKATVEAINSSGNYVAYRYEEDGTSYIEAMQVNKTLSGSADDGIMLLADGDVDGDADEEEEGYTTETVTGTISYSLRAKIINEGAKTASLEKISNVTGSGTISIGDVNEYSITTISSDCLTGCTNDFTLAIGNSVIEIGDSAFKGNSGLRSVTLGSGVTTIGANAFSDNTKLNSITLGANVTDIGAEAFRNSALTRADVGVNVRNIGSMAFAECGSLKDVYFTAMSGLSDDDERWSRMSIAADAFSDGSNDLTFHGEINPNYSPYVFASQYETAAGVPICYETDAPLNLVVVKDKGTNKMTLIDYTHYEELATEALTAFTTMGYDDLYDNLSRMTASQQAMIRQALYMEIPEGIESIDAKTFYTNKMDNSGSILAYLNTTGRMVNSGTSHQQGMQALYSTETEDDAHPGLFSGAFYDTAIGPYSVIDKTINYRIHTEDNPVGNDVLKEITMKSVETLPAYAFESNENLQKITLGSALSKVGELAFKGCAALTNITVEDNPKYLFNNMMFYEYTDETRTNGKLITCLESRGVRTDDNRFGSTTINATSNAELSTITEIETEAFADCKEIAVVDLSSSNVAKIPSRCFEGCDGILSITLPKTTSRIEEEIFNNVANTQIRMEITNPLCVFDASILDGTTNVYLTISGEQYLSDGSVSPCYQNFELLYRKYPAYVNFVELGTTCTVAFVDKDLNNIRNLVVEKGGSVVEPPAAPAVTGYDFVSWKSNVNGTVLEGEATYTNVTEDRIVVATYEPNPSTVVTDGNTYTLTVTGGTAVTASTTTPQTSLTGLAGGTQVTLVYNGTNTFSNWTVTSTDNSNYSSLFVNAASSMTTFTMPNANVTVVANTTTTSGGTGTDGTGDGTGSGSGGTSGSATQYTVTVNYGSGSGEYAQGETVTITANAPDSSSRVFSRWSTTNTNVTLASATSSSTTFVMPAAAVVVTANYRTRTSGDSGSSSSGSVSESDRLSSRHPSSTVTTTTTANAANTGTTGTQQGTATTTQDELYINADGISNTGLGSLSVEGATDNFVTRITESDDTRALVEEALINRYGSLDGIIYSPLDITLYDVSGTNVIEDTTGLDVTITMPIPDAMIAYGGNVSVAAVENGQLQDITPRFTTIDGISCVSFVPPHFSPYVVYVDTNNLAAGSSYDATPATGDPIHPKWFLAIGMACMSVLLFVTGDKKRLIQYGGSV